MLSAVTTHSLLHSTRSHRVSVPAVQTNKETVVWFELYVISSRTPLETRTVGVEPVKPGDRLAGGDGPARQEGPASEDKAVIPRFYSLA